MTRLELDGSSSVVLAELAETFFEQSSHGLLIVDQTNAHVLRANAQAERWFGRTSKELAHTSLAQLLFAQADVNVARKWAFPLCEQPIAEGVWLQHHNTRAWTPVDFTSTVGAAHTLLVTLREKRLEADELRASERRVRKLIEHSADVVTILDAEGRILYETPNGIRSIAWHDGLTLGSRPIESLHPDDRAQAEAALQELLEQANLAVRGLQLRLRGGDGLYHWIEVAGHNLLHDTDVAGILLTWRDISQRKANEERLQLSETRLANAQRVAGVGNWEWFIQTGEIWWSGEMFKMLDLVADPEADLFEKFYSRLPDEDVLVVQRAIRATLEEGAPYEFDHRVCMSDGRLMWMHVQGVLERNEQGMPICLRGILLDVTAQKEAEASLRRSEQRLAEAQRIAKVGNWEWHAATNTIWWSDELLRILGYDPAGPTVTPEMTTAAIYPDDAERVLAAYDYSITNAQSFSQDYRLVRPDGRVVWLHVEAVCECDEQGKVTKLTGISQDITERKRKEDEHLQVTSRLQEMQRLESLGVLAGGVAHDFNNLLTPVLGYANLAREELAEHPIACGYLQAIETAAQRAAELCQQMLAYAGKGRFIVRAQDLGVIVSEIVSLAQASIPKEVQVQLTLPEELPLVMADANQLRQVAMNLVLNAAEAMKAGGQVRVTLCTRELDPAQMPQLRLGRQEAAGHYVGLEVSDQGCGMTRDTQALIFDPFFTTKFTGRGLGLSAVQGIVRGHQGLLELESQVDRGTTFRVWLPVYALATAIPSQTSGMIDQWRGRGTILVVDDEPIVRTVAVEFLRSLGFQTAEADDGRAALRMLDEQRDGYVAMLLDHNMPQLNGEQTFRGVRNFLPQLPIILMTGYSPDEIHAKFPQDGLAGTLHKPFTREQLRRLLQAALPALR